LALQSAVLRAHQQRLLATIAALDACNCDPNSTQQPRAAPAPSATSWPYQQHLSTPALAPSPSKHSLLSPTASASIVSPQLGEEPHPWQAGSTDSTVSTPPFGSSSTHSNKRSAAALLMVQVIADTSAVSAAKRPRTTGLAGPGHCSDSGDSHRTVCRTVISPLETHCPTEPQQRTDEASDPAARRVAEDAALLGRRLTELRTRHTLIKAAIALKAVQQARRGDTPRADQELAFRQRLQMLLLEKAQLKVLPGPELTPIKKGERATERMWGTRALSPHNDGTPAVQELLLDFESRYDQACCHGNFLLTVERHNHWEKKYQEYERLKALISAAQQQLEELGTATKPMLPPGDGLLSMSIDA
jgi:hypothetical protein